MRINSDLKAASTFTDEVFKKVLKFNQTLCLPTDQSVHLAVESEIQLITGILIIFAKYFKTQRYHKMQNYTSTNFNEEY